MWRLWELLPKPCFFHFTLTNCMGTPRFPYVFTKIRSNKGWRGFSSVYSVIIYIENPTEGKVHHTFVTWDPVCIFGVCAHVWRGRLPPTWHLSIKFLQHYILRSTVYECGNFRFSGQFGFWDMIAPTLSFIQWYWRDRARPACKIS